MKRLPIAARILVILVAAGGAAALVARAPNLAHWNVDDVVAFALLTAGIIVTEQFQIPLRFGPETLNFSLTEALWVGALILGRPSVVTMSVAAGIILGQGMRRWAPHKVAFNAGQFLLALTAAQSVVRALRSPDVMAPSTLLAVGLGMAAYAAINAGLVALVISRAQERPFAGVFLKPLPENAVHFVTNTALGLTAAVAWHAAPEVVPLLALPLAMSFMAYRVLLDSLRTSGRLRGLAR
jgi:hypothetical protein